MIRGKTLVQHVWERACELETVERVVVATDDERIAAAVRGFGGAVVMTGSECVRTGPTASPRRRGTGPSTWS